MKVFTGRSSRKLLNFSLTIAITLASFGGITAATITPASAAVGGFYTTASPYLNARSGPGTGYSIVGTLNYWTPITVKCQVQGGTNINGNATWDKLTNGTWIADYWTTTPSFNSYIPGVGDCNTPPPPPPPPPPSASLTTNQVLRAGQYLQSSGATYQLWMQGDGNLVLYSAGRALWNSGTWGNSGAWAVMQGDGNLVVYSSAGRALWNSGTWGNSGATAVVQSDGNFVIYSSTGKALWSSRTGVITVGVIGDDYPYKTASMNAVDPWNFYYRNCTSFAAWRLNSANRVGFTNWYGGRQWGNANQWDDTARALGIAVNGSPRRGAIAQTDAGWVGHVAWVAAVNVDGTVTIEEYNYLAGAYSSRRVAASAFNYIHIRDL